MVLTLVVLKLTYRVLSGPDFIVFNSVLFALGVASGCFAPSLRAVWRSTNRDTATQAGLVNVAISMLVASAFLLFNRTLTASHGVVVALAVTASAAVYCGAKALERMIYAYGFVQHEYALAFGASSVFIVAELVVVMANPLGANLASRLLLPPILFLLVCAAYARSNNRAALVRRTESLSAAQSFFRTEYLNKTAVTTVIYTVLFGITGMVERIYPSFFPASHLAGSGFIFKDYLLVLAYGVAFQSLVSIAVDWARPRIIYSNRVRADATDNAVYTGAWVLGAGAAGCLIGFWLFRSFRLIPEWVPVSLWSLILLRASGAVLIYLTQVDLVISGRLVRASLPWILIIASHLVLLGTNLSIDNLQRALFIVVVEIGLLVVVEAALMVRRLKVAHP